MKTLFQIINQEPVYLHNWENEIDIIEDFENTYMMGEEHSSYKDINILFASYGTDNYSGDAWVLFEKDGKLYEVNGSHCSCYGLEGQWDPDEVVLEELENRLINGDFGEDGWSGNEFNLI